MAVIEFNHVEKIYTGQIRVIQDFSLTIKESEFMVMVGPSGCGKSTLMRMLAGLEQCTSGEILLDGQIVNDWTPQQRNVAMVFQNYALYPHMTVRGNLEFPLRMRKMSRDEIDSRVNAAQELLGLSELLDRKPSQLSGGQRQRVAMGRALVRDPSVFLMDEPLSNLDARLRVQIRTEIGTLQRRMQKTTLYVTHDQVEAMTLGDRVCVLNEGVLQQVASPLELYQRPDNIFVASFLGSPGMNLFGAVCLQVNSNTATFRLGEQSVKLHGQTDYKETLTSAQTYVIGIRPEDLSLIDTTQTESKGVDLRLTVESVESLGHEHLVYGNLLGYEWIENPGEIDSILKPVTKTGRLTVRLPAQAKVSIGNVITLTAYPEQVHLFALNGLVINRHQNR